MRVLAFVLLFGLPMSLIAQPVAVNEIVLPASGQERNAQVITLAPTAAANVNALRDQQGRVYPLQRDTDGRATFLVPTQKADEELRLAFASADTPEASLRLEQNAETLSILSRDAAVIVYQKTPAALPTGIINTRYRRGAYLHPVFTPAGRAVTHNYPANHPHHHGIWTAWTNTEYQGRKPDFWNMHRDNGSTVEFVRIEREWSGPVESGFVAHHRHIDLTAPQPTPVLDEQWTVRVYAADAVHARIFDLEIVQRLIGDDPLLLKTYHYGGLGIRGSQDWETAFHVMNSAGITDRKAANAQRSKWAAISGPTDGSPAGLAVLEHPSNPRAPQPVRVHPTMPYINYTPVPLGDIEITRDKPYIARYRFVAFDGPADANFLEACWQGFTAAATAR